MLMSCVFMSYAPFLFPKKGTGSVAKVVQKM